MEAQGDGGGTKKRKVVERHQFKVVFGMPWTWDAFAKKAVASEHPFLKGIGVPWELQIAINKHAELSEEQLRKSRLDWCKKWLVRARDLDHREKQSNEDRHPHVASVTTGKRLLLTREILEELH